MGLSPPTREGAPGSPAPAKQSTGATMETGPYAAVFRVLEEEGQPAITFPLSAAFALCENTRPQYLLKPSMEHLQGNKK